MPCSEYVCLVGTCTNPLEDPHVPCSDCVALFGPYLRASGGEAADEEVAAQRARAEAKAVRSAVIPVRQPGRPPRLTALELAEEAVHLVGWCGLSDKEAAGRLGVSKARVEAALRGAA